MSLWKGKPVIVYAMPGSQFTFKVLAALTSRGIPHAVDFVPLQLAARETYLPSGGFLVPEVTIGPAGPAQAVVADSERILHWFDAHSLEDDRKLFPANTNVAAWSERANSQTLCGMVWYYGYVNDQGYANSMQKSFAKLILPSWLRSLGGASASNFVVDRLVASERQRYRGKVVAALSLDDESALADETAMRSTLVHELEFFQSLLVLPSATQPFLLQGATEPTAADFSLYAQLNRLVGTTPESGACDIVVDASLPALPVQEAARLRRLWEWHALMCANYPGHFKGKRVVSSSTTTGP
jgi:glutathione S-transferase